MMDELAREFDADLIAFSRIIERATEEVWTTRHGNCLFGQEAIHVVTTSAYYLRHEGTDQSLNRPIFDRYDVLQPGLKQCASETVDRKTVLQMIAGLRPMVEKWFTAAAGDPVGAAHVDPSMTNLGVSLMELRHVAYHAGHMDSVLREHSIPAPGWGYDS